MSLAKYLERLKDMGGGLKEAGMAIAKEHPMATGAAAGAAGQGLLDSVMGGDGVMGGDDEAHPDEAQDVSLLKRLGLI